VLGTCPTLAITTAAINGIGMGVAATVVLLGSNLVISLLRNIIPSKVRIPAYITVIAGFVTIVQMLVKAFLPSIDAALGIYLPLIVVNCIILGRAEMFANKNTIGKSALDGLGMGIGFTLALLSIAIIREVLGAGSFADMPIPFMADYKIKFLVEAPGGFMVYGMMIALVYKLTHGKAPYKKEFSCENCPSAAFCNKACVTDKEEN
jgi:electron transport complex protein RnfE